MVCSKCGGEISDDSTLCENCGLKLSIENEIDINEKTEGKITEIDELASDSVDIFEPEQKPSSCCVKHKKEKRVLKHTISFLLSLVLCFFLVLTIVSFGVRVILSPASVCEIIEEFELDEMLITDLIDEQTIRSKGLIIKSNRLAEVIYDNLGNVNLTENEFLKLFESEEFENYLGVKISTNLNEIAKGYTCDIVPDDVFSDFLKKDGSVKRLIGRALNEDEIAQVSRGIEKFSFVLNSLSEISLETVLGEGISTFIRIIYDWDILLILISVDLLLMILLILVSACVRCGIRYCGVSLIITGSTLLVAFLCMIYGFVNSSPFGHLLLDSFTFFVFASFEYIMAILGAVSGVGVLLLITASVISFVKEK